MRRRSTGRTCRRTISPAARRRNGCRCATQSFYSDNSIDLRLNTTVAAIDTRAREVSLAGGDKLPFDRLLLATGAEPVSPSIPGAKPSDVLVLRSLKDCRAIIERAKTARRAVVLGASFIGLEVAASLQRAQHRGPCRRAGRASDGENSGPRLQPPRASDSREPRRRLPFARDGERRRGQARNA